jgi:hybrid cluster-associated redox disulfide protein
MSRIHDTLRARLRPRVRRLLQARGARAALLHADMDAMRATLDALRARTGTATRDLARMRADQQLWSRPFAADMTIDQAWRRHPAARDVFAAFHLPACDGCAVRFDETLAEASTAYGLDGDALLQALNDLLAEN